MVGSTILWFENIEEVDYGDFHIIPPRPSYFGGNFITIANMPELEIMGIFEDKYVAKLFMREWKRNR